MIQVVGGAIVTAAIAAFGNYIVARTTTRAHMQKDPHVATAVTSRLRLMMSLAAITMTAMLCLGSYFAYLLFWPQKVIVIEQPSHLAVLTPVVHPGESLGYRVAYCKYRHVPSSLSYELVGPTTIFVPGTTANAPVGCATTVLKFTIPTTIPGTYRLILIVETKINALRTLRQTLQTDPFIVSNPAKAGHRNPAVYHRAQ